MSIATPAQPEENSFPPLPVRVEWVGAAGERQAEMTILRDATPRGATLALSRPLEVGQLLSLTLPAAKQTRLQCQAAGIPHKSKALVWALAESAAAPPEGGPETFAYAASVVFIHEDAPAGADSAPPAENVYVADDGGLFRLYARDEAPGMVLPQINRRRASRINIPVEVTVEALDENGNVTAREQTVTENISYTGAAVLTTLVLPAASIVRLTSESYQITLNAVVCAHRVDASGIARLHLSFIDREWPLEGIC